MPEDNVPIAAPFAMPQPLSPESHALVAPTTAPPQAQPPTSGYIPPIPAIAPEANAAAPLPTQTQALPCILTCWRN